MRAKVLGMDDFWSAVRFTPSCWHWTGRVNGRGYGEVSLGRHVGIAAHRFAYMATVGRIPDGLVLDHLCRRRLCVNPSHLEPVTSRENTLRGVGAPAVNAKKRTCARGHDLSGPNLRIRCDGRRLCRICHRNMNRPYKWAHRKRDRAAFRSALASARAGKGGA